MSVRRRASRRCEDYGSRCKWKDEAHLPLTLSVRGLDFVRDDVRGEWTTFRHFRPNAPESSPAGSSVALVLDTHRALPLDGEPDWSKVSTCGEFLTLSQGHRGLNSPYIESVILSDLHPFKSPIILLDSLRE